MNDPASNDSLIREISLVLLDTEILLDAMTYLETSPDLLSLAQDGLRWRITKMQDRLAMHRFPADGMMLGFDPLAKDEDCGEALEAAIPDPNARYHARHYDSAFVKPIDDEASIAR